MAIGFEPYQGDGTVSVREFVVATGVAVAAGGAVILTASQAGKVTNAADGSVRIVGVAVHAVASTASGAPTLQVYDPRGLFRVNRKAAETAGPTHVLLEVDFEDAVSIDHSDAAANKPVLVMGVLSTGAAGESLVTFSDTIYGNRA